MAPGIERDDPVRIRPLTERADVDHRRGVGQVGPDQRVQRARGDGQRAVDMYQTPTDIVIKTMVAGVKPEDLDISITRDMVTIHGKRMELYEVTDNDFFHKELYWGSFSRTIILPAEVEIEEAEAAEKHGLLTLILPKIDKNRQSKLKVRTN
jgi:HSP20 family protein